MPAGSISKAHRAGFLKPGVKLRKSLQTEVLRKGERLIQDRETRLALLDALIMRGIADADANCTHADENIFDELLSRYKSMMPDNRNHPTGLLFGSLE